MNTVEHLTFACCCMKNWTKGTEYICDANRKSLDTDLENCSHNKNGDNARSASSDVFCSHKVNRDHGLL